MGWFDGGAIAAARLVSLWMGLMRNASSGKPLHSGRLDCDVRNSEKPGRSFLLEHPIRRDAPRRERAHTVSRHAASGRARCRSPQYCGTVAGGRGGRARAPALFQVAEGLLVVRAVCASKSSDPSHTRANFSCLAGLSASAAEARLLRTCGIQFQEWRHRDECRRKRRKQGAILPVLAQRF